MFGSVLRFFCGADPDADESCLFFAADDMPSAVGAPRRDMTWVSFCAVLAGRGLSM